MKNKDKIILNKILGYCNQANEAYEMFHGSFQKFQEISVFHNACCMCILQIGELCKLVSDELRNESSSIPWKEWCGIRDIFAHQYSNIDYNSVWATIQEDLPALQNEIKKLI